jgi:sugar phosphate isomerase/epimerase
MDSPAVSPVPIAERIAAIADAGFCGFGLVADDLRVIHDDIGFEALRDLIFAAGLVHTEIELLERWWIPRGQTGSTYDVRDLLFEAADVLEPSFIKIGSENGPPVSDPLALAEPLRELAE